MENESWIHWPHPSRLKWKAPAFEGKMGVILFTTLTKRGGQAVFRVHIALRKKGKSRVKSGHFRNAIKTQPESPFIWKPIPQNYICTHYTFHNWVWIGSMMDYTGKKKTWHVIFKPKACIDSKLSHPLQDVVSDRPVHTSWALFVPGMWSPSNRSQQLSQWNGKRRIGAESGRGGHCINIASTISPPPQSSCSVPLHTKTPQ